MLMMCLPTSALPRKTDDAAETSENADNQPDQDEQVKKTD